MRLPVRRGLALAAAFALLAGPVRADEKGGEAKPADARVEPAKGPYIAWARSHAEAAQEASERDVCIYLHSHGST